MTKVVDHASAVIRTRTALRAVNCTINVNNPESLTFQKQSVD